MTRERKLLLIFSFNLALMTLEIIGGVMSNSLALISDAGHMLTDSLAIFLSYLAIQWSKKPATPARTFGYHRTEILVAMINGLALLGIAAYIFYEAFHRFHDPLPVRAGILLVVAVIGLAGNLTGMLLLRRESHENLNIRGAFFHLMGDTLSSVGVITAGVIIALTGWTPIDPLISIIIGGIVLRGGIELIWESGHVLLEATPKDINIDALKKEIEAIPGVRELHDIHIWTITSGRRALSAHVLIDNIPTRDAQIILCAVRERLTRKFTINHTTLEAECDTCKNNVCEFH